MLQKKVYEKCIAVLVLLLILFGKGLSQTNEKQDKIVKKAEKICYDASSLAIKNTSDSRQKAWQKILEARKLFQQIDDIFFRESWCLENVAVFYSSTNTDEALKYYKEIIRLAKARNNKTKQVRSFTSIGKMYSLTKKMKAFDYHLEAFELALETKKEDLIVSTSEDIAFIFTLMSPKQRYQVVDLIDFDDLQIKDVKRQATFNYAVGEVFEKEKKWDKALEKFNKALSLNEQLGDKKLQANLLNSTGIIYGHQGELEKAQIQFEKALSLSRELNDKILEYIILKDLGSIYFNLGNSQKGYELLQDSIKVAQNLNRKDMEAFSLHYIADLYRTNGEDEKALVYFQKSLEFLKANNGKESTLLMFMRNLAGQYVRVRETDKALEILSESLELAKKRNSWGEQVYLFHEIGDVYKQIGEFQKALEYYKKAEGKIGVLEAKKEKITRGERQFILRWKPRNVARFAGLYAAMGDSYQAVSSHWAAFMTGMMTRQYILANNSLSYIAPYIATRINLKKEAFKMADNLLEEVKDSRYEPRVRESIADIHYSIGEYKKALEIYEKALNVYSKQKRKSEELGIRQIIFQTHYQLGNKEKAFAELEKALKIAREVGNVKAEASITQNIGNFYRLSKENQKAIVQYKKALQLYQLIDDKQGEARILGHLGAEAFNAENPQAAVFYLKSAVNRLQEVRNASQGIDNETQKSLLAREEVSYRALTSLLINENRLPEALEILNTFKDQQFFDFNKQKEAKSNLISLTPRETELSKQYELKSKSLTKIGDEIRQLRRRINRNDKTNPELLKLEEQKRIVSKEFSDFLESTETEFAKPNDEKDKIGQIAIANNLQETLQELNQQTGENAVAIYTLLNDQSFKALIVTSDKIKAVKSELKGETISKHAKTLWGLLQSAQYDPTIVSKKVYDAVFEPIEKELPKDTKTLMWSLDGNLRYIPMATLFDGEKYLVERYKNTIFTRTDKERLTRKVQPKWTGIGFGSTNSHTVDFLNQQISFSSLPGVDEELKAIFKQNGSTNAILQGEVLPDAKFTKDSMLTALKQKHPLVHIASHFSFRPGDEARSFLLLGDGNAFSLADIKKHKDLFQGVDLLTLSACNTAAQQTGANGREVDGFAELAQRLGAGAVMATLWQVSDASTPVLMSDFYKIREQTNGITKAEALRQAQISLLKGTKKIDISINKNKDEKSASKVKIEILSENAERSNTRGVETFSIKKEDAPIYKSEGKPKFAHPYYWSPFVLYGNWK